MRRINSNSHTSYLHARLMQLLPNNSFSSRLRKTIGAEIDAIFKDGVYAEMGINSASRPIQTLFSWISSNGGITPDYFENEDGSFFDDQGEFVPTTVKPLLPGVEQLAAFGLWFLDVEMNLCGAFSEEDYDVNHFFPVGWTEVDVLLPIARN